MAEPVLRVTIGRPAPPDLSQIPDEELEAEIRAKLAADGAAKTPNPVPEWRDNPLWGGVLGGAEMGYNGMRRFNDGLKAIGTGGIPALDRAYASYRAQLDDNTQETAKTLGNVAASVVTSAPIKGPATVVGGAQGALMSTADDLPGVIEDALWGAGGAFASDRVVRGLSGAVSPTVRGAVKHLQARGIPVTPGLALGGAWKTAEDLAMSIPLVGPAISSARKAGRAAFEEATANNVVEAIKAQVPKGAGGRDAVRSAAEQLKEFFTTLTPRLGAKIDPTFVSRILASRARAKLPQAQADEFDALLHREMSAAFDTKTGRIDGRRFKQLEERLRDLSSGWRKSDDAYQRDLGTLVGEVREHMFSLLQRQNPEAAKKLRAVNKGYRNYVAIEGAAGTASGEITPARLFQGIRAADRSARNGAAKRGTTGLSQLAQDGYEVLGDVTPNSTAADGALFAGGLGLFGTGAATVTPYAALAGLGAVPYLPGVRKGTEWVFTGRQGATAKAFANWLRRHAPVAGAAAPPLLARPER